MRDRGESGQQGPETPSTTAVRLDLILMVLVPVAVPASARADLAPRWEADVKAA